jgi:hypothetical protein
MNFENILAALIYEYLKVAEVLENLEDIPEVLHV